MKNKVFAIVFVIIAIIVGLIFYNKNYVDNYNFKLNGSNTITLTTNDTWEDPLYTIDGDKEVVISDNINYNQIGEYQKTYSIRVGLFEKKLVRRVNIVDVNQSTGFTISLQGNNPYYLMKGHAYQEEGYNAFDSTDGKLTEMVITESNIDNKNEGTYEVKYQVKNSDGITKIVTRKVIVYSFNFEGKIKTTEYTDSNEILLNIYDNNYNYTLLPNGTTTTNRNIIYQVVDNKLYSFTIYDNNGNSFIYEANITNIDKELPTGSCTLSLLDNGGKITVTAIDNNNISGYEYIYGNNKTNKVTTNTYSFTTMDETASVTIYDSANNNTTITCNVVDNSTKVERDYTLYTYTYNGVNRYYWLYQPKISKRDKVPLVVFFHGAGPNSTSEVNSISIPKNIKDGNDFPYYVLIPYYAQNKSDESYVLELINYITGNYHIDTKRIVLAGQSLGSPTPLRMAANKPNTYSCIVLLAAYNIDTVSANTVTGIPIWLFQGTGDSYQQFEKYINNINTSGGNAKITSYTGSHNAPANAFLREDLTNWILNNRVK